MDGIVIVSVLLCVFACWRWHVNFTLTELYRSALHHERDKRMELLGEKVDLQMRLARMTPVRGSNGRFVSKSLPVYTEGQKVA